ncbi:ninjurin-1-like isoform X2 [Mizuhopecten yessoensis]|uniref:Ninjurin-2 n=2 Tax=Mizuhopecten yessoensis TaxID=6573 RepID=A0A210Q9B2_MIZYE|nr:ninjurin-1-like isoform X2 [Mizuhopecten yessoensis]XP_021364033.1 ninjurin-1-like isoform X2 [Mizuhopecten yessoensis]OWF45330.1 Ninjurin-2 [Mizuhopecten yessoensis]
MGKKKKSAVKTPGANTGQISSTPDDKFNPAEQFRQFLQSFPTQGTPTDKVLPNAPLPMKEKSKKIVTTKTFTKGMMDVSLLTSNATQLRSILMDTDHTFRNMLIGLLIASVFLQVTSTLLLILADSFKTNDIEQNPNTRRRLSFSSLALTTLVTVVNILISAFHVPGEPRSRTS